MTFSGRLVTAASDVIGIDDVFEARIAVGRKNLVCAPEDRLLHVGVLDDRLDQEVGFDDLAHRGHALEHVTRSGATLLGELAEALLHGEERTLDRSRHLVVERDPPPRGGHHLCDAAAHLASADDENVPELHARSISETSYGSGAPGRSGRAPLRKPAKRPQEDEREHHDPDRDLDRPAAGLAALGHEWAWLDDAAGGREPRTVGRTSEQEPDRLVLRDDDVAVGARWAPNLERPVDVALDALIDLDREQPLWRAVELPLPLGDDSADHRGVGIVESIGERSVGADARRRRAREGERGERDDKKRLQTSISNASP